MSADPVCPFFKRLGRKRVNVRQRISEAEDGVDDEQIIKPKRIVRESVISAKVESTRRREDTNDSVPLLINEFSQASSAEPSVPRDMGATAQLEIDTPFDQDEQARLEKSLRINKEQKNQKVDKIYRGSIGYQKFYEHEDKSTGNAASGHARSRGPMRAPVNIRVTTRWDYQPDICKDYKETGFCGFGDSCKFLHDRTEYKFGWELERDEMKDSDKCNIISSGSSDTSSDDDDLPFNCPYCRKEFMNPVKTKCNHYFCEKCALAHFSRTVRCMSCGEDTEGKFTPCSKILDILKKRKDNLNALEGEFDLSGEQCKEFDHK